MPDDRDDAAVAVTETLEPGPQRAPSHEMPRLSNRYRVLALLGSGGMGSVYRAFDTTLEQEVAIKVLRRDGIALARVRDEVKLAHRVTHPNVCRTYDLEEVDGQPIIKMEYVAGETLAEKLRRDGPLPIEAARRLALQLADGLAAAHARDVVHCDLKPQNIVLEERTNRVVIMDFGVARALSAGPVAGYSGTPAYMAPEQWRGEVVDGRTDLYALGCLLYEALTGELPFRASTLEQWSHKHQHDLPAPVRSRRKEVPARLARIAERLLQKAPDQRFHAARAVASALRPNRRGLMLSFGALALIAASVTVFVARRHPVPWQATVHVRQPVFEEAGANLDISPDGKWIVYDSDGLAEGSQIYVEPMSGGEPRDVTPPGWIARFPRWTKAGIFFISGDGRGYLLPPQGGEPDPLPNGVRAASDCGPNRLILTQPHRLVLRQGADDRTIFESKTGHLFTASCNAAGTEIAFVDGSRVDLVSVTGGQPRTLGEGIGPRFTPLGRSVVYSVWPSAEMGSEVRETAVTGGETRIVYHSEDKIVVAGVTPDGRQLLFFAFAQAAWALYELPLAHPSPRRITTTLDMWVATDVSADGRELLTNHSTFSGDFSNAVVLSTADWHELASYPSERSAKFTPDDASIVYTADAATDTQVWMLARAGGPPRRIAAISGHAHLESVDADSFAHLTRTQDSRETAIRVNLRNGEVSDEARPPVVTVLPAPTGGWRIAIVREESLRLRVIAPGHSVDEPHDSCCAIPDPDQLVAWARDGRTFFYTDGRNLRRHVVDGGDEIVSPLAWQVSHLVAAPGGKTLYFSRFQSRMRRMSITNFSERPWR